MIKVYHFSGHLNPLPPGISLGLQISGDVCLASDVRSQYGQLISLAADLARGTGLPSDYDEDHPQRMRRSYWLKQLERAHNVNKDLAMRLRAIADGSPPGKSAQE